MAPPPLSNNSTPSGPAHRRLAAPPHHHPSPVSPPQKLLHPRFPRRCRPHQQPPTAAATAGANPLSGVAAAPPPLPRTTRMTPGFATGHLRRWLLFFLTTATQSEMSIVLLFVVGGCALRLPRDGCTVDFPLGEPHHASLCPLPLSAHHRC
jgi:hypothetical protein